MSEVLFVNACMRGEGSRTLKLCKEYLAMKDSVIEVDLSESQLKPFSAEMVEKRVKLQEDGRWEDSMFNLSHQFAQAEEIVIGAPYWDLSFPAALKVYIEHVSVCDITFHLTDKGEYEGLSKAKHITYISSCGGFIADDTNFGFEYISGIAKMFGILELRYVVAEGLDVIGTDIDAQMDKACETLKTLG